MTEADEADGTAGGTASDGDDGGDTPDEMRAALAEVRRERRTVAFVYASIDATCVLLAVYFAITVLDVPVLTAEVAAGTFAAAGLPAPDVGTLVALLAGLLAFLAELWLRTRRPAAEQFEAANPAVSEALRTARDAAEADRADRMTRALYADVLDRLRETSSVELFDATRLAATVAVALVLSAATVQTAVVGLDVGLAGPESSGGGTGGAGDRSALPNQTAELRSGDEVLGRPTDVSAGSENLSAAVSASPGGGGERKWDYETEAGSGAADDDIDAQRAAFASPDRVEEAALVQRYARRLDTNATDD